MNTMDGGLLTSTAKKEKEIKNMFKYILFTQVLINVDHGILPAATFEMRNDLQIDEMMLGLIGSLVFAGLIAGSLGAGPLFQKITTKKLICFATTSNVIALLIFPLSKNIIILGASRVMAGFFQVFCVIYFPVWVDLYGENNKTMWLALLQVSVPIGVFLGYAVTAVLISYLNWKAAFFTQVMLMIPCVVKFYRSKSRYMATSKETGSRTGSINCEDEEFILSLSHRGSFLMMNDLKDYMIGDEIEEEQQNKISIDENEYERISKKATYWMNMRILWSKKVFIFVMLSTSTLYFVVTGLQYWISDYMINVLGLRPAKVFLSFGVSSITAPTAGVLAGGYLIEKFGGYTSKYAMDICIVLGLCASLSGIFIPFLNGFWPVAVLMWFVLFFGGSIMPSMTGMMISSIPQKLRAFGSSTAQLVFNLLGYFPAPFLYGAINSVTGGPESRAGMIMLMTWSFVGMLMLYLARRIQKKRHERYVEQAKEGTEYHAMSDTELEEQNTPTQPSGTIENREDTVLAVGRTKNKPATLLDLSRRGSEAADLPEPIPQRRNSRRRVSSKNWFKSDESPSEPSPSKTELLDVSGELSLLKGRSAAAHNKFHTDNLLNAKNIENMSRMFGGAGATKQQVRGFRGEMI